MSAGGGLQTAVAVALNTMPDLTGVYDGAPVRAAFPYVTIDASSETDWGHKSGAGREVNLAITLWDDDPVRLHGLADSIEDAVNALVTAAVAGWQVVGLRLIRRKVVRDVTGPWAAAVDYRARMLALG